MGLKNEGPWHPIKGNNFFAIPESIASNPDVTDSLFRLLAIILPRYSENKAIKFKTNELAILMNKRERQTRAAIKDGVDKGYFKIKRNGKGLDFIINKESFGYERRKSADQNAERRKSAGHENKERRKSADQSGGNPPVTTLNKERTRNKHDKNGLVFIKTKHVSGAEKNSPVNGKKPPDWITSQIPNEHRKKIRTGTLTQLAECIPKHEIPTLLKNAFEKCTRSPQAYISGAINRHRQSLTAPSSGNNVPVKPTKELAEQKQKNKVVSTLHLPTEWSYFIYMLLKKDRKTAEQLLTDYPYDKVLECKQFCDYLDRTGKPYRGVL